MTAHQPELPPLPDWDLPEEAARALQLRLAPLVSRVNSLPEPPRLVAGVEVSAPNARGQAVGVAALLHLPDLEVAQVAQAICKITFPYIPGLLAFREAPGILEAISRLGTAPDFVIVDGHGLAHPRRFGLACHVGVLTGLPTIGCAGSLLVGTHGPVGPGKGAWAAIRDGDEVIGAALRTRDKVRPVYVSIGHKVDLPSAIRWTLACCGKYRLPELLRVARESAREKMRLL